jgi:hypothetical protein
VYRYWIQDVEKGSQAYCTKWGTHKKGKRDEKNRVTEIFLASKQEKRDDV